MWHSLEVPNEVDLLKQLANEGLQAQPGESITPKVPMAKKKGKKAIPLQGKKISKEKKEGTIRVEHLNYKVRKSIAFIVSPYLMTPVLRELLLA